MMTSLAEEKKENVLEFHVNEFGIGTVKGIGPVDKPNNVQEYINLQ